MVRSIRVACVVLALGSLAVAQSEPPSTRPVSRNVRGVIERVESDAIVVRRTRPRAGVEPTTRIAIEANVVLRMDGSPATLEQVRPGMDVVVQVVAEKRYVVVTSSEVQGRVVRVDGTAIVIRVAGGERRGEELRVETDEKTVIGYVSVGREIPARTATLADFTEGTIVQVVPATGVAKRIIASPPQEIPTTRP